MGLPSGCVGSAEVLASSSLDYGFDELDLDEEDLEDLEAELADDEPADEA